MIAPGTRLSHFEISTLLGAGGMGEVYKARDTRLDRIVAIKVLPAHLADNPELRERFEREARTIASLNHPHICTLHDIGRQDGTDFLVMEYLEGETLATRLLKGPLPLEQVLQYAIEISDALDKAHRKGVTHRDIKPGNVMLTKAGTKLLDFGLAKLKQAAAPASLPESQIATLSRNPTVEGTLLGTIQYMAPEQVEGKQDEIDGRTDIFAFGALVYEMATGKKAFEGKTNASVMSKIMQVEPPPMSSLQPVTPPALERVVKTCLAKDPEDRWQSARDVTRELKWIAEGGSQMGMPAPVVPGHKGNNRLAWVAVAIAIVVTLVAASLAWTHFRESPPVVQSLRFQITLPGDAEFYMFQLSPDGRYLAYTRRNGNPNRIFVRALDSLEERELPGTDAATYPFWAPDSTHIAFFAQGKLKQVALSGGPATNIADAPDARGGAWGPDGTIVFAPTVNGGLSRVSPSSGAPATPLKLPGADNDSLRFPAFLPDPVRFLYVYQDPKLDVAGLYVGFLDGTPPVRILQDMSSARFVPSPGSSTSGHLLFLRDSTLMAQPFDAASLKTSGEAFPLAGDVRYSGNTGNAAFTVAANGTLLYLSGGGASQEREIAWLDRGGKVSKPLLKQKGIDTLALSPNGARVMYSTGSQNAIGDLWLYDVAHGTTQRFTFGPFSARWPMWSPDSATVVFTAQSSISYEIYRKATQSSAKEESLVVHGTNTMPTSWPGDGKLLVYSQTGDTTKDDLWLLPLDGDRKPKLFKQTPFNEAGGQISPDGRWMVYTSDASGQFEVYIEPMPAGGAQRQISAGGGQSPVWRNDGRELYFVSGNKLMAVEVKPGTELTFGMPHELFGGSNLIADGRRPAAFPSTDGSQFLALLPVGDAPAAPPLTVVTNWQAGLKK